MEVYRGEKNHVITDQGDADSIIYQKGFSAGQEHSKSSPETLKKLAQMSEDITNLKVATGKIETKIDSLTDLLKAHMLEENENKKSHEKLMETKADKYIVDDLKDNQKWVIRSIIGMVISAVIGLIIVK
jgi:hypothetical protein